MFSPCISVVVTFIQPYIYPYVVDTLIYLAALHLFYVFIFYNSILISNWGIISPSLDTI